MGSKPLSSRYAIFRMDAERARQVFRTMEHLAESGLMNMRDAMRCGLTRSEWNVSQHIFLSSCSKYKEDIKSELFGKR